MKNYNFMSRHREPLLSTKAAVANFDSIRVTLDGKKVWIVDRTVQICRHVICLLVACLAFYVLQQTLPSPEPAPVANPPTPPRLLSHLQIPNADEWAANKSRSPPEQNTATASEVAAVLHCNWDTFRRNLKFKLITFGLKFPCHLQIIILNTTPPPHYHRHDISHRVNYSGEYRAQLSRSLARHRTGDGVEWDWGEYLLEDG